MQMHMADLAERKALFQEVTPRALLPPLWRPTDYQLIGSLALFILGTVLGTYYWSALIPAFEQDKEFQWGPQETRLANTLTQMAESAGLLLNGPLADYFATTTILTSNCCVNLLGMVVISSSYSAATCIGSMCVVCYCKGVMWPTASATLAANLHREKQDSAFLSNVMGSRSADIVGGLFCVTTLGTFQLGWRSSMRLMVVLVGVIFSTSRACIPSGLKEPADQGSITVARWCEKFNRLLRSPDSWLAFVGHVGSGSVWAMYAYVAPLLQDMYNVDEALAGAGLAALPAGQLFGLCAAIYVGSVCSVMWSRIYQLCQTFVAIAALVKLWHGVDSYDSCVLLTLFVGIGSVVPLYMPGFVYMATCPAEERAYRYSTILSLQNLVNVFTVDLYGRARAVHHEKAAPFIFGTTAIMLSFGYCAMMALYVRVTPVEESNVLAAADVA